VLVQALLSVRVIWRLVRTAGGERIMPVVGNEETALSVFQPLNGTHSYLSNGNGITSKGENERVTVIVPVLNERNRILPCLEGLIIQGAEVAEILAVDGGSVDGTQEFVRNYSQSDPRVRLIDASPIPADWNGKAWGLHVGFCSASSVSDWILTVDADVRPSALLTLALLGQAKRLGLQALSVAVLQEIDSFGEGLLHPSLLTTLVYRFGMPGKIIRRVSEVQANGQCFLFKREALEACGGFQSVRNSLCEDITIARTLVASGYVLGFYEAGDLISVKMYRNWQDVWQNWTRSLPMHDRFSGINTLFGWLEVALIQALPLPLLFFLLTIRGRRNWLMLLNSALVAMRIGVLFGTARAYQQRPWSYWLSPLCDLPVAVKLARSALQRQHVWRGRILVRGGVS
jgi:dolichol-phosphate mannosyltransferase